MKVLTAITTHKRPKWCLELLKQINNQNPQIRVVVFHDKDDCDYSQVVDYCKEKNYTYLQSKENFGKWEFYKLNNFIYQYADSIDFDYFVQLPDDVILCNDFFSKSISLLGNKGCLNPLTLNFHKRRFELQDKQGLTKCNWADCCFVTHKKYIKGLRLSRPSQSDSRLPNKGSGTGSEFSRTFVNNTNQSIYISNYGLVYHRGDEGRTVMHEKKDWHDGKDKYYKSRILENDFEMNKTTLSSILKGKTVAFVGLAPNIKGKGLGQEIDKADIVYRTNMFPVPEHLQKDYGTRCDILALLNAYVKNIQQYRDSGVENIIHYGVGNVFDNVEGFNVFVANPNYRKSIANCINSLCTEQMNYPTAGLIAYFICKQYGCKSFKFYGVTGYQNENKEVENHKGQNHYIGDYLEFWDDRKERLIKTDMVNNKYHNFKAHNEFLRILVKNKSVQLDEFSKPYFL